MRYSIRQLMAKANLPTLMFVLQAAMDRLRTFRIPCPYCQQKTDLEFIDSYVLILEAFRCCRCGLIFRNPDGSETRNLIRYRRQFEAGIVSDIPSEELFSALLKSGFRGNKALDRTHELDILSAVKPVGRVLDFGCSWGYTIYQMIQRGYDATGFEISKQRARFAQRRFGFNILDDMIQFESIENGYFDIIFSSQVLEHIPNLRKTFDLFSRLLPPGGVMLHVTPMPVPINEGWIFGNREHITLITEEFCCRNLPKHGFESIHCFSDTVDLSLLREEIRWPELSVRPGSTIIYILAKKKG
jgi:2-polyprenyl-3-methyl-5-hydroxy-6-metoxy-1,4-benzoquinol methylase